ncbi:hypothetical protein P3T76_005444 [Phytophthora citrophthora]|uniref:Uncharacterized protein n=1 Tax=Phytophthora citrophthora TaxID=4793 RepID=A0AAD9GQD8_9STRA|nr:hypothetical protein P3T76_005444 [Phytophthora citrophthora]
MVETSVERQLLRLHVLLGDDENQLERVYQVFQEVDRDGQGSLKNATNELERILQEQLSPKDFAKIDVKALATRFSTANRFDYAAFCKSLQQPPTLQTEPVQSSRVSPTKRRSRSPTRLQTRDRTKMRVDKRLESQRLLMESVRQKLIRGVQGSDSDGFQGIHSVLHRLDVAGEGYLDASVFMKKFIQRLKTPLTRPEREFLLEQLRAQSTKKDQNLLDYEQLGRVCNLDSDDSVSDLDADEEQPKAPSPSKTSQLGANFLAAEKRLNEFLRSPVVARNSEDNLSAQHTPRCVFTGAERFLEMAESTDQENTGLLPEGGESLNVLACHFILTNCPRSEFHRVLSKCGLEIDPDLLIGMLSRFQRSSGNRICYAAFLEYEVNSFRKALTYTLIDAVANRRYGLKPQYTRGRRELKQLILQFFTRLTVPAPEWARFLYQRFEKYDRKIHGTVKNALPMEGRSVVLKLTTEEAAQVTSLFLRSSSKSSSKHLHYHEFLLFIDECHRVPTSPTNKAQPLPRTNDILPPTSPKAAPISQPEVSTESTLDTEGMSVGDYVMYHALPQEQRNFEKLMEVLQDFRETHANSDSNRDSNRSIQRITNGIILPLVLQMVNQSKSKCQLRLEARSRATCAPASVATDPQRMAAELQSRIARANEIRAIHTRQLAARARARVQHAQEVARGMRVKRHEDTRRTRQSSVSKLDEAARRRHEQLEQLQLQCKQRADLIMEKVELVRADQHDKAVRARRTLAGQLDDAARRREERTQQRVRRLNERWQSVEHVKDRVARVKFIQRWFRRQVANRKTASALKKVCQDVAKVVNCWTQMKTATFEDCMGLLQQRPVVQAAQRLLKVLNAEETGGKGVKLSGRSRSPPSSPQNGINFRVLMMAGMISCHPNEIMGQDPSKSCIMRLV